MQVMRFILGLMGVVSAVVICSASLLSWVVGVEVFVFVFLVCVFRAGGVYRGANEILLWGVVVAVVVVAVVLRAYVRGLRAFGSNCLSCSSLGFW